MYKNEAIHHNIRVKRQERTFTFGSNKVSSLELKRQIHIKFVTENSFIFKQKHATTTWNVKVSLCSSAHGHRFIDQHPDLSKHDQIVHGANKNASFECNFLV